MVHYYLLIVILYSSCIWWSSNGLPLNYDNHNDNTAIINHPPSSNDEICQQIKTYNEIIISLTKTPCVVLIEKETNDRMKRDVLAGNVDIHALQTTINDHRSMINYLMNNSVNFTVVADAINDHHTRTGPIFTSWRDLTLLLVQIVTFSIIIYFLFCYIGCRPMDHMFRWILKPINNRLQQPTNPINQKTHQTRKETTQQPITTISQNIPRYHHHHHHDSITD